MMPTVMLHLSVRLPYSYIFWITPGISKVLSVVGSGGLQGCMFCDIKGTRNEELKKTIYLQNRRFLSDESPLRNDKER